MSNNASLTLEQSLARTEADAQETWDVAKDLLRPLRRLRSAAETGNSTEIDRSIAGAQTALAALQRQLNKTKKGWDFDTRRHLSRGGYAQEVLATAKKAGNGLRGRSRSLRLFLALRWCWLSARGSSWSIRSLHSLCGTRGAIHRRLRTWEAALRPVIHDCLASERAARIVAPLKNLKSRYLWSQRVRQTGHCCQRGWMQAVARFRTGFAWLQNWTPGNRFLASLIVRCTGLAGQIRRSERMKWAPGTYRRVRRWCGRLALCTRALTCAWPSTGEITGQTTRPVTGNIAGTAPTQKRFLEAGVWFDAESPLGYARISVEYFPPPEPELEEPELEKPQAAEFRPDHFLLDLFRAYSQLLEQRGDGSPRLAPVVPLVDLFALLSSVSSLSPDYTPDYSGDYTKEDFIRDVYRLHFSGVDTTLDGARVSFPISRGVKGKTLTVTDEAGHERRYYGVRFLGQVASPVKNQKNGTRLEPGRFCGGDLGPPADARLASQNI